MVQHKMYIRAAFPTPTFEKKNKMTYRQAETDSSEFKKCNYTSKKDVQNIINIPARHGFTTFLLHESKLKCRPKRKVLNSFFMKKVTKWVKIALENFAKIQYILHVLSLSEGF